MKIIELTIIFIFSPTISTIKCFTMTSSPVVSERKSEEKCKEYHDMNEKQRAKWIIHPMDPKVFPEKNSCHLPVNPLITKGQEAITGEFPHMVALGWLKNGHLRFYCGASLISEQWAITAAHCTHRYYRGAPSLIQLGSVQLNDTSSVRMRISRIIRHPNFKPPSCYSDVALIQLEKPVAFSTTIQPACLYPHVHKTPPAVFAVGWGTIQFDDHAMSKVLLKTRLDIIDNIRCASKYKHTLLTPYGISPSMVCAGDPDGGWQRDTCQGDSGGPIQTFHETYCLGEIVGIISFGTLCATPTVPSVHTRVSFYLDWIEGIVWP